MGKLHVTLTAEDKYLSVCVCVFLYCFITDANVVVCC